MADRFRIFSLLFGLALLLIVGRLVFLTVFMGGYYRSLAVENGLGQRELEAKRGAITDRSGKVLAESLEIDGQYVRFYPFGEILAHVVGYVNADGKGVFGLEKYYDNDLLGMVGKRLLETEAVGRGRELGRAGALAGKDIKTNIDFGLQKNAYLSLKEKLAELGLFEGAVVVSKVNGEVTALVSLPAFDPNLFVNKGKRGEAGGDYARVGDVLADEKNKPLFDRAVGGAYAPGSVYKLVPALAGLAEGVVDSGFMVEDEGEIKIGEDRFGNWYFDQYGRVEGSVNVVKALARSNDIFFYKLGESLGEDKLIAWTRKLGLGTKTGIDLTDEVAGLVPDPLWRERTLGSRWYLGNTYHLSIGQGDLMATPLQINRMTAAVVSGKKCSPRLAQEDAFSMNECEELGIEQEESDLVVEGMRRTCSRGDDYNGTAYTFFDLEQTVYCKTGTAQQGGEDDNPHAWISVIVPNGGEVMDWEIVTVMLPAGGEGSSEAGAIARGIVDYILAYE